MAGFDDLFDIYKNNSPLLKLDRTFYFDESNNIKKGVIGFEKDNNEDLENLFFVLGGIGCWVI